MKQYFFAFLLLVLFGSNDQIQAQSASSDGSFDYPETPVRPVTDTYFGKEVTDNYRWMEDMKSAETQAWFRVQGEYTDSILNQLPGRDSLIATFERYDQLEAVSYGRAVKRGDQYFYRKTLPGEAVGKLYTRKGESGKETLLLDPRAYDLDKEYAMKDFILSPDGQRIAIGLQEGGGELATVRIMRVADQTFEPDSVLNMHVGDVEWMPDGEGFLYTPQNSSDPNDPKGNLNTRARLHRLGTDVATDREVFSRAKYPDLGIRPDQYPVLFFSNDDTQLYGSLISVDNRISAWVADPAELAKETIAWKRLAAPADSVYDFVKLGDYLYLHSVKDAPNGQILVTDADHPNPATATVLLPEGQLNITGITSSKDYLFVTLNDGVNDQIRQYAPGQDQWTDVPLPMSGTAWLYPLDAAHSNEAIVYLTSWKQPLALYNYRPENQELVRSAFDVPVDYPGADELVVEELEIPGLDGTMVPLSLIYKKGLKKDGSAVCFMNGYGAYGFSAIPYFSTRYLAMLNQGVIVAITHPRGGSEKGQEWYRAGFQTTKPNTWRDFIASGEYLVENGYTSPEHLIGMGTSAGGILIGRAITERPKLFAAAISNVSCSNALRMEESPNGPVNVPEFGTVEDSLQAMALYEMDALHHVEKGTDYPAVICVGGMNDPRVIAWQPGKFAAALQQASTSDQPVLMQVNYDNGHFTEDKQVTFRNFANMFAFALWQAGHPAFQPLPQPQAAQGSKVDKH